MYRYGLGVFIAILVSAAHADMARFNAGINPDIAAASNQISVGWGALKQDYREYNDGLTALLPSVLDSETGTVRGLRLGYTGMIRRIYVQTALDYARGNTDYVGYLQSPGPVYTPFNTTTRNTFFDLTVRVGYTFRAESLLVVVPYIEVGEHIWYRQIGPSTPYYSGSEDYVHLHIGPGVKLLLSPIDRLVWELGAGYGINTLSTMTTGGYTYTLGDKGNLSGYTGFDIRVAGNVHLKLNAEYRKWEYGQSDVQGGYLEPRSLTRQVRYLVAVGYSL